MFHPKVVRPFKSPIQTKLRAYGCLFMTYIQLFLLIVIEPPPPSWLRMTLFSPYNSFSGISWSVVTTQNLSFTIDNKSRKGFRPTTRGLGFQVVKKSWCHFENGIRVRNSTGTRKNASSHNSFFFIFISLSFKSSCKKRPLDGQSSTI